MRSVCLSMAAARCGSTFRGHVQVRVHPQRDEVLAVGERLRQSRFDAAARVQLTEHLADALAEMLDSSPRMSSAFQVSAASGALGITKKQRRSST